MAVLVVENVEIILYKWQGGSMSMASLFQCPEYKVQ